MMLRAWHERYPSATLHGVELQPYMLQTARRMASEVGATIHEADLHTVALPLADASVDAILSTAVVHEMREPIGMLREAHRLLGPDGRLMLMDWIRVPLSQYLTRWDDDPLAPEADPESRASRIDHFMEHNKLSREDLLWLIDRCGFAVEHTLERGDGQFLWLVARPRSPAVSPAP